MGIRNMKIKCDEKGCLPQEEMFLRIVTTEVVGRDTIHYCVKEDDTTDSCTYNDVFPLSYTHHDDTHGNKIYENDVVRVTNPDGSQELYLIVPSTDFECNPDDIEEEEPEFYIIDGETGILYDIEELNVCNEVEVIGNADTIEEFSEHSLKN